MTSTHARGLRGLGTFYVKDSSGNTIDCDLWSNIANLSCWGVVGGSTGTPVKTTTDSSGQVVPTDQPDCTQLENWTNNACSVTDVVSSSPLALFGLVGAGLLLVLLLKR